MGDAGPGGELSDPAEADQVFLFRAQGDEPRPDATDEFCARQESE